MISKRILNERGKELAFLLRHDKDYSFDSHGWRDVQDLYNNHGYTKELLEEIVRTDSKGRYEFDNEKKNIRARQGHSVNVNPDLIESVPPEILYHGTSKRFLDSILSEGIQKMSRTHVHLSKDIETAIRVGERHGAPVVLKVFSDQMSNDGVKFFLSGNGVWLTDYVDPKYIEALL